MFLSTRKGSLSTFFVNSAPSSFSQSHLQSLPSRQPLNLCRVANIKRWGSNTSRPEETFRRGLQMWNVRRPPTQPCVKKKKKMFTEHVSTQLGLWMFHKNTTKLVAAVASGSQFRFRYLERGKVWSFMQMTQRCSRETLVLNCFNHWVKSRFMGRVGASGKKKNEGKKSSCKKHNRAVRLHKTMQVTFSAPLALLHCGHQPSLTLQIAAGFIFKVYTLGSAHVDTEGDSSPGGELSPL